MRYASGKRAKAVCDQCGLTYPYLKLKRQWDGLRTCPECFDAKHPQLTPKVVPADAEALRHPRPGVKGTVTADVGEFMWWMTERERVGAVSHVGTVTVVTS